jgi:4-hydroxy-tetrahydrodipicolinate reductase
VLVIGLGAMGIGIAWAVRAEAGHELVALHDADPAKQNKTLDELCGHPAMADDDPRVAATLEEALTAKPAVAVVCTASKVTDIAPLLDQLIAAGVHVVTSCEQMLWPWYSSPELAARLDDSAKTAGVAVLGTGVNPGLVMDALPVFLASAVRRVERVRCVRRVDAATRRPALQAKVGATLEVGVFAERASRGELGHVGLAESLVLLAAGLGREVPAGAVQERVEPVVGDRPIASALGLVPPGRVTGVHQTSAWQGDGLSLLLDLTMAVGVDGPIDEVHLQGPVSMCLKIPGSTPGDSATIAILLHHIRPLRQARPGLRTMLDMPRATLVNRDA